MSLISVIVPIYNVEQYLERCILSILNQTYHNYELILVNDGSTDGSLDICKKYAKKFSGIIVVDKKNGGLSDARNAGLKMARGEYITFVDSDDLVVPNYLEILINVSQKTEADIVFSEKFSVFSSDTDEINIKSAVFGKICKLSPAKSLERIFCQNTRWEACGNLYTKKILAGEEFHVGIVYEDLDLIPRLVAKSNECAFVDVSIYYYYKRANSIMGNSNTIVKKDLVDVCNNLISVFKSSSFDKSTKDNIITGLLLELSSRIDLAENHKKINKSFIVSGRQCILSSIGSVIKAKKFSINRKLYIISFAIYMELLWKPIYKHLIAKKS